MDSGLDVSSKYMGDLFETYVFEVSNLFHYRGLNPFSISVLAVQDISIHTSILYVYKMLGIKVFIMICLGMNCSDEQIQKSGSRLANGICTGAVILGLEVVFSNATNAHLIYGFHFGL